MNGYVPNQGIRKNREERARADLARRPACEILGEDMTKYDRFVQSRVRGLVSASPVMDRDDIRQEGYVGLCRAAQDHNSEGHDAALKTFAHHRIRGQAQDAIRVRNGTRRYRKPTTSLDRLQEIPGFFEPADQDATDPQEHLLQMERLAEIRALAEGMEQPLGWVATMTIKGATIAEIAAKYGIAEAEARELRKTALEFLGHRLKASLKQSA